jgi:hypothetical protein
MVENTIADVQKLEQAVDGKSLSDFQIRLALRCCLGHVGTIRTRAWSVRCGLHVGEPRQCREINLHCSAPELVLTHRGDAP